MIFLLPIPITFVLALLWFAWAGRQRGPLAPAASVAEFRRARRALARTTREVREALAEEADPEHYARSA